MSTTARGATGSKEIAVGLVLYGGVSLAIYENGVVRAFHDLALKRNGFRFLLA